MALNLISKNNIGIVATLILVILLCQSKYFIFLTGTSLGKMFLLAMLIMLTYFNKTFGILGVIFVIIAFNLNDSDIVQSYNFYEGLKKMKAPKTKYCAVIRGKTRCFKSEGRLRRAKLGAAKAAIAEAKADKLVEDAEDLEDAEDAEETFDTISNSVASGNNIASGREGFCMPDRELNILRGKQSNAIPVFNKSREHINEVEPTDNSAFSSDYAPY
jgi:hypothetical protein